MERSEVLEHGAVQRMKQLKLYGMKAAYDEIVTTAIKRCASHANTNPSGWWVTCWLRRSTRRRRDRSSIR